MTAASSQPDFRRRAPRPKPEALVPEINVTPLVDVVLVLLIIFMVIAPSLEHGERVELPGIFQPDKAPASKLDPITLTVARSGTLYLEKEPLPAADFPARLAALHGENADRRVVLKGDSAVDYAKVRELFVMVQDAGFSGVSLMVSKRGPNTPEDQE